MFPVKSVFQCGLLTSPWGARLASPLAAPGPTNPGVPLIAQSPRTPPKSRSKT